MNTKDQGTTYLTADSISRTVLSLELFKYEWAFSHCFLESFAFSELHYMKISNVNLRKLFKDFFLIMYYFHYISFNARVGHFVIIAMIKTPFLIYANVTHNLFPSSPLMLFQ